MWQNDYDLDIAVDIVATMQGMKIKEELNEVNPDRKRILDKEIVMMQFELNALYKEGELQQSVMDKAFRLYAPIIKRAYVGR